MRIKNYHQKKNQIEAAFDNKIKLIESYEYAESKGAGLGIAVAAYPTVLGGASVYVNKLEYFPLTFKWIRQPQTTCSIKLKMNKSFDYYHTINDSGITGANRENITSLPEISPEQIKIKSDAVRQSFITYIINYLGICQVWRGHNKSTFITVGQEGATSYVLKFSFEQETHEICQRNTLLVEISDIVGDRYLWGTQKKLPKKKLSLTKHDFRQALADQIDKLPEFDTNLDNPYCQAYQKSNDECEKV